MSTAFKAVTFAILDQRLLGKTMSPQNDPVNIFNMTQFETLPVSGADVCKENCQQVQQNLAQAPLHTLKWPTKPWQRYTHRLCQALLGTHVLGCGRCSFKVA